MNIIDAASLRFLGDYGRLKAMWKCSDAEMARRLGCDPSTIVNLKKSPCSVNGGVILQVQENLHRELRKLEE